MGGIENRRMYQVNTPVDDSLMVNYAPLAMHFADVGGTYALAKTIMYPVFLNIVHYSGLPYQLALTLIWILCGGNRSGTADRVRRIRAVLQSREWPLFWGI